MNDDDNFGSGFLEQPPNSCPRMEHIWAFLSVDPADGNEGVIAANMGPGRSMVPLIASDKVRLDELLVYARRLALENNIRIRVVKFTVREEIEEL
jgi:hypothetical protein